MSTLGMTKVSKKEQAAAQREAEAAARKAVEDAWLAQTPLSLLKLSARAEPFATVVVRGGSNNLPLRVEFNFHASNEKGEEEHVLYLSSDKWSFQLVEAEVEAREVEAALALQRLECKRAAYDKLNDEERQAIGMTRRP